MTNKHLWIRRLSSLLFLTGVVIAGCGNTVDDQDAGPQCAGSGCDAGPQCAAGEIFRFVDGSCGRASPAGACGAVSTGCDSENLVCGCDGTVYQTVCEANEARVDITFADQCAPPQGTYACGTDFCARNTSFCSEYMMESDGSSEFNCESVPPECASPPSCECFLQQLGYDECESDGMGGVQATVYVYTD